MAKEDCFAYVNENKCLALCELDCDGCSFYQTVSQLKKAREKAKERISTLDSTLQTYISDKYGHLKFE